jgi:2-dehydro-3-deoxyphosphogluconate aldolase/(4S)-4-hydroxy-2-oxoglutarate aldolase
MDFEIAGRHGIKFIYMGNRLRSLVQFLYLKKHFAKKPINIHGRMSLSKKDVLVRFRDSGVLPVFYHPDVDALLHIVSICYKNGLRVFEFMHQRDNRGLRFFSHLTEQIDRFPGLVLGVGTVLDATMTERYIRAGAQFIASPFLRADMGRVCEAHEILWMPGCATADEADLAVELNASAISVLPGNILGHEFIAPLSRRYPDLALLPSGIGDFRESSLAKWFESGACALKIGPQVFSRENVSANAWSVISHDLSVLINRVKHVQTLVHPQ